MQAFLKCCWHIGGSQSDVAHLEAEDIGKTKPRVSSVLKLARRKSFISAARWPRCSKTCRGRDVMLFPRLAAMDEKTPCITFPDDMPSPSDQSISLHSYRYAWAERAKTAGYPERFAREALGHNSKAVHRAYARRAQVKISSLEDYEKRLI
jgi:hypothetical protein